MNLGVCAISMGCRIVCRYRQAERRYRQAERRYRQAECHYRQAERRYRQAERRFRQAERRYRQAERGTCRRWMMTPRNTVYASVCKYGYLFLERKLFTT